MLDLKTCSVSLQVQHIICCPHYQSIIVYCYILNIESFSIEEGADRGVGLSPPPAPYLPPPAPLSPSSPLRAAHALRAQNFPLSPPFLFFSPLPPPAPLLPPPSSLSVLPCLPLIEEIIHDICAVYKCFTSLHLHILIHSRDVLASPQILNMPDRVNWKVCKLSKDEEISNAKSFRTAFEPFDFNLWIIILVIFICLIIKYLLKDGALVLEIGSIIYCPPTVQQFLYYNSTFWHKHRTNIHP